MKRPCPEPEVLPAFRLLAVLVLGLLALDALALPFKPHHDLHPLFHLAVMAGTMIALLAWLTWHRAAVRAGRWHLPLAIALFLVAPFASEIMELGHPFPEYTALARERLLLLFPPLLIVAWQYRPRAIVLFALGTAALDLALTSLAYPAALWLCSEYSGGVALRALVLLACGLLLSRLVAAQRDRQNELRDANARLARYAATLEQLAVARERTRLAWELHDTAAQALSGLAVQLEAARTLAATAPEQVAPLLERALAATREGLGETRRAIQALHAEPLAREGLVRALRQLAEAAAGRLGAALACQLPSQAAGLPAEVEALYFRVAQEALENAARHSRAGQLSVTLSRTDNSITMTIADNGIGFDTSATDPAATRFGIQHMHERAELLGAKLEIASRPNAGCLVRLEWEARA